MVRIIGADQGGVSRRSPKIGVTRNNPIAGHFAFILIAKGVCVNDLATASTERSARTRVSFSIPFRRNDLRCWGDPLKSRVLGPAVAVPERFAPAFDPGMGPKHLARLPHADPQLRRMPPPS